MKVKTDELIGPALDWAVYFGIYGDPPTVTYGPIVPLFPRLIDLTYIGAYGEVIRFSPSSNWSQGGPLIKRFEIQIGSPGSPVHVNRGQHILSGWEKSGHWSCCTWEKGATGRRAYGSDKDDPLIAAMRTLVVFLIGNEVDIPDALLQTNPKP
jgi:hypothetical protein